MAFDTNENIWTGVTGRSSNSKRVFLEIAYKQKEASKAEHQEVPDAQPCSLPSSASMFYGKGAEI